MAGRNRRPAIEDIISDEVRKQQGETPTFPLGEETFEEKSTDEIAEATIREAREKAEIERTPGGAPPRGKRHAPAKPD